MFAQMAKVKTILVCCRERHVSRLIQVNLERYGYSVLIASDIEDAIRILPTHMALLDSHGYEVLALIRTHDETKHMYVMAMLKDEEERRTWEQSKFRVDKYLTKSWYPTDLFR